MDEAEVDEVARIWIELDYCTRFELERAEDRQGSARIDDVVLRLCGTATRIGSKERSIQ